MLPTIVRLADHIFSWQVVRYCNKIGCAFHCSLKFLELFLSKIKGGFPNYYHFTLKYPFI